MKRTLAVICAALLVLSLSACGQRVPDYALGTVWGEIAEINGTKVTLTLGEISGDGGASGGDFTPPDMPDGSAGGTPPEKPDGESGGQPGGGETPPDLPGGAGDGNAPSMPGGGDDKGNSGMRQNVGFTAGGITLTVDLDGVEITENRNTVGVSDLAAGKVLCVRFGEDGKPKSAEVITAGQGGGQRPDGGNGGGASVDQGSSANTVSENGSYTGNSYTSVGDNENALRIDGATADFDGITVDKSAGATSNAENGDFYGVNAAILATGGATVTIKNSTVTSAARNGNGVFSYGKGTTVNIYGTRITTSADNSGGIQTTGGGTTNAYDLTVSTSGNSSASITVKNALLTAANSEALVIEGKNSITLEGCTVFGNMSAEKSSSGDINVHNIMLYQSMSGDADVGTSSLTVTGGTLTGSSGDMIFVTNTNAVIRMSGVAVENKDGTGAFLRVAGNNASHGWGTAGKNGAEVTFTADAQTVDGDIIVDSISTLDLTLENGSVFTGAVNIVSNAEGGTAVADNAMVTVGAGCTWNLTGDCTVTSLTNNGTINFGGHTVTLANGTVLRG